VRDGLSSIQLEDNKWNWRGPSTHGRGLVARSYLSYVKYHIANLTIDSYHIKILGDLNIQPQCRYHTFKV
jgi:hypothetical protein